MEKFFNNAERRRINAENKEELSLSHWLGELHAHTKTDISRPELPDDIALHRKGSNCGGVPLRALIQYHGQELKNKFIAITEHSRDADPKAGINGMTGWFMEMYLSNSRWLLENFLKNKDELSEDELAKIKTMAREKAKQVANYGDERIEEIMKDIEDISAGSELRVFKGIEASLMPGGSLDTKMVEQGKFDSVNCSIHPHIDREAFKDIITDPDKYSDLALRGIENNQVNIISHLGEDIAPEVAEKLRWEELAENCLDNKVALEINLKELISFIYKNILDYEKYPKNDNSYRQILKDKLDELVPIFGSPQISQRIKPYFPRGLKIAINTDEHKNRFIRSETDKSGTKYDFALRDLRYWRALKIVEEYFNEKFKELEIKKENIINTYSVEELEKFFKKQ